MKRYKGGVEWVRLEDVNHKADRITDVYEGRIRVLKEEINTLREALCRSQPGQTITVKMATEELKEMINKTVDEIRVRTETRYHKKLHIDTPVSTVGWMAGYQKASDDTLTYCCDCAHKIEAGLMWMCGKFLMRRDFVTGSLFPSRCRDVNHDGHCQYFNRKEDI